MTAVVMGCCGKPRGCSRTDAGCAHLRHPWKRAVLSGETSVRCQATCVRSHPETGEAVNMQCVLRNGHEEPCDPQPRPMTGCLHPREVSA